MTATTTPQRLEQHGCSHGAAERTGSTTEHLSPGNTATDESDWLTPTVEALFIACFAAGGLYMAGVGAALTANALGAAWVDSTTGAYNAGAAIVACIWLFSLTFAFTGWIRFKRCDDRCADRPG